MAKLQPIGFPQHLESIYEEYRIYQKIYGYSADFFFKPNASFDLSVQLSGKMVATPLGPAAGPHTQLAQNILLSWLHGSRIIELKTIQVLDDLDIPRPCIDMRNVGYNVEWSQELSLDASFKEYASAWTLINLMPYLDIFDGSVNTSFYKTIFDMSVGYDLQGISSNTVSNWLNQMSNAKEQIHSLLDSLPSKFSHLKSKPIPDQISDTITLSTFHGCPPAEIEQIVEYLIAEHHLNVVVKMNPTLGGLDFTADILNNHLGYKEIQLEPSAFEQDLNFDDAVAMMQRLNIFAAKHKTVLGAKFSNTLVVKNHEKLFNESQRYLSGPPLYVLALQLAYNFRQKMGTDFPLSFSGGITKNNFAETVAANFTPVTTCTDLLKKGGYKKLYFYLENIQQTMQEHKAENLIDFVQNYSADQSRQKNIEIIAKNALQNSAYHQHNNKQMPKKIESHLTRFDCLSCDICIPVCPNVAIFNFRSGIVDRPISTFGLRKGHKFKTEEGRFKIQKENQIGILVEFCNQCGNCDTFCPEQGGPYLQKSLFFLYKDTYLNNPDTDGFYFDSTHILLARLKKNDYRLEWNSKNKQYLWKSDNCKVSFKKDSTLVKFQLDQDVQTNSKIFEIMRTVFEGIRTEPHKYPQSMLLANQSVFP